MDDSKSITIKPYNPEDFLILVVDDIAKNLQLVVEILDEEGYATTFATSGFQALERIETAHPDLILLDLMMPEISGLEVCKKLKSDHNYATIPIIFITASNEQEDLLEAFKVGAVDYLTKPFRPPELLARVKTHLDLKRTRDELKKAYIELEKLVNLDPLTNIPNRRALFKFGEREFRRAQRYNSIFSVLMLDLDHFKNINDNYGHDIGDHALKLAAHTIFNSLRTVDQFGRFGGEEFVAILPETKLKDALIMAERIRSLIAQLFFPVQESTVKITISIGVAAYKSEDKNLDEILKRADQALFQAKRQGRNQVVVNSE